MTELAVDVRRARTVVAVTLVLGTAILAGTLAVPAGSGLFYALGFLSAVVWIAGAWASGPVPVTGADRNGIVTEIVVSLLLGALLFGAFVAAKLVADHVSFLSGAVTRVLARADAGPRAAVLLVALLNAVGEEVFFRGALFSVLPPKRAALGALAIYVVVTVATFNPSLVAAALVMGAVFTAERRTTGRVLAPLLTHLSWSTLMILFFPR